MKKRTQSGIVRKGLSQEFYLVHFNKKELNNSKALEKAKLLFDPSSWLCDLDAMGGHNPLAHMRETKGVTCSGGITFWHFLLKVKHLEIQRWPSQWPTCDPTRVFKGTKLEK